MKEKEIGLGWVDVHIFFINW